MAYTTIPASSSGAACAVTLVQSQTVSGADAADVTFSGLSGDADIIYKLIIYGVPGSGITAGTGIFFEPNALTSNQGWVDNIATSTTTGTISWNGGTTGMIIGSGSAATGFNYFSEIDFYAKTGGIRLGFYRHWRYDSTPASRTVDNGGFFWSDTSTAITSIKMHSGGNVFGIGTVLILYKVSTS